MSEKIDEGKIQTEFSMMSKFLSLIITNQDLCLDEGNADNLNSIGSCNAAANVNLIQFIRSLLQK
jgi:hypothetical protein